MTLLEATDSQLEKYMMHGIEEELTLGQEIYPRPEILLEAALTQLAFGKINREQPYRFFHETDIDFNEVCAYAKQIFKDEQLFIEKSQAIAKHLHNVLENTSINRGDLFIGLFDNCLVGTEKKRVLALVKIDEKELFLDVKNDGTTMEVHGIDGINVKKANNAAIIVDMGERPPLVFIRTRKKEDTIYWQERFLNIRVLDEQYEKTANALQEAKKFILKEENYSNTEKLELLNKTLDYFKSEENFEVNQYVSRVFEQADDVAKEIITQSVKPYETMISESAIEKVEKNYKRKIKLDDRVEIVVNVRDVETIDEVIETGVDEQTGRKYYKIYFQEEQ